MAGCSEQREQLKTKKLGGLTLGLADSRLVSSNIQHVQAGRVQGISFILLLLLLLLSFCHF